MFEGTIVGEKICEAAHRRGAKVVLLPTIPYGTETNMHRFPLAINVDPTTLFRFVTDIVQSLHRQRRAKDRAAQQPRRQRNEAAAPRAGRQDRRAAVPLQLVHGARRRVRRASSSTPTTTPARWKRRSSSPTIRTSSPRRADGKLAADDGATAKTRFDAVNRGWVSITRPWHLLTTNTGSGYPHAAAAEKTHAMMKVLVDRLATFLVELSAAKIDERFPY